MCIRDSTVTIECVYEYKTDYTQLITDSLVAEQTFTITVKPCQINDYYPSTVAQNLKYHVGDPSETGGSYAFT